MKVEVGIERLILGVLCAITAVQMFRASTNPFEQAAGLFCLFATLVLLAIWQDVNKR